MRGTAAHGQAHPMAFYDPLTGLPQRQVFIGCMEQVLAALAHGEERLGAVLMLDIDDFRKVNETYGLDVGDQILREIGRRLSAAIRPHDSASRTTGDEFMVLLTLLGADRAVAARDALKVAGKLHEVLIGQPFQAGGASISIQVSIGLTLLDQRSTKISQVLQEAGMALHRAEEKGGDCIVFFSSCIQARIEERLSLERDLSAALKASQLRMDLQPQHDEGGRVVGAELLARWTHPERGVISPAQFIPVAMEAGLMPRLTRWSLRAACETLARLQGHGVDCPISVNINPRSLLRPDFVSSVQETLERTGALADRLIFEITEEAWLEDLELAARRMKALNRLGIRFSIDDFGSGFTNLTYLRRLPLDELKIDKSLIQGLPEDADSQAIIRMILGMARQLGLRVVAEGIETGAQAGFLFAHGCDAVQGFWKARPMPVEAWVAAQARSFGFQGRP
ncbi:putative bifunctional diguanylate cyclase/phosphodiesterase [Castellaniella hirudinis]|uniref:Bifunctional diguanylate cyclase/phosphodiesterase n=1 Tax=Castellaniella hirudinis TaxID=1144617 RepID=A0ABV8RZR9_9BURK